MKFAYIALTAMLLMLALSCTKDSVSGPGNYVAPKGSLDILKPKLGDSYKVGQTIDIKWQYSDEWKFKKCNIYISTDNGVSWDLLKSDIPHTNDSWQWNITARHAVVGAFLKIEDAGGQTQSPAYSGAFDVIQ